MNRCNISKHKAFSAYRFLIYFFSSSMQHFLCSSNRVKSIALIHRAIKNVHKIKCQFFLDSKIYF